MDLTFQTNLPDDELPTADELCQSLAQHGFKAKLAGDPDAPEIILDQTEKLILEPDAEGAITGLTLRITVDADEQAADQLAASLDELGYEYEDDDEMLEA